MDLYCVSIHVLVAELVRLTQSHVYVRWIPYPVIVTIRDKKDNIRVLLSP